MRRRLAFYAPLKSPQHATPSGDREIGRRLLRALSLAGWEVEVVSSLRSYDRKGCRTAQLRIEADARSEVERVATQWLQRETVERPVAWLTYHLYHKAPDWLGPRLCEQFRLPYLVAEASVARKQANGPWGHGYAAALEALSHARRLFNLNPQDADGLRAALGEQAPLVPLRPFLDTTEFIPASDKPAVRCAWAQAAGVNLRVPWVLCVAMMRPGNKVASLLLLARSLMSLLDLNWQVLLVGDGDARRQVLAAFETLGTDRVHWLGLRTGEEIVTLMQASDLFAWPAIDEPMGMAMLEAQACALPVVAGDARGVPDIVAHEVAGLLVPEGNEEQFALALRRMLEDSKLRNRFAIRARAGVEQRHGISDAGRILNENIEAAIGEAR